VTVAALPAAALLAAHVLGFGAYTLLLGFLGLGRVYPVRSASRPRRSSPG